MAINTYIGTDTIIFNDRILTNFADGDVATVTRPNDNFGLLYGYGGNTAVIPNDEGKRVDVTLRILWMSDDYKFLLGIFKEQELDLATASTITANFFGKSKNLDTGLTETENDILTGGIIQRPPDKTYGRNGNIEVAVATFTINFMRGNKVT